jgi:hypothetical protein
MDLGHLRPRAPDNAADHVRRDRDVLHANTARRCFICGGGRSSGDGDKGDGEDAAAQLRAVGEVVQAAVNGVDIGEGDAAGDIHASSREVCGVILYCMLLFNPGTVSQGALPL